MSLIISSVMSWINASMGFILHSWTTCCHEPLDISLCVLLHVLSITWRTRGSGSDSEQFTSLSYWFSIMWDFRMTVSVNFTWALTVVLLPACNGWNIAANSTNYNRADLLGHYTRHCGNEKQMAAGGWWKRGCEGREMRKRTVMAEIFRGRVVLSGNSWRKGLKCHVLGWQVAKQRNWRWAGSMRGHEK